MNKRLIGSVVLAGGIAAAAGGSALVEHGGQASAAQVARSGAQSNAASWGGQADLEVANAHGTRGQGGFGGRGGKHQAGYGLTVSAVDAAGNTITAKGRNGLQVKITVSPATTYTEAGAKVDLSAVTAGEQILVKGQASTDGSSIQATAITVVLPRAAGVITAKTDSQLTITSFNGTSLTVLVNAQTRYQRLGKAVTLNDLAVGEAIAVEGTRGSDGSLTAVRVEVRVPSVFGKVQAVSGNTITLTGRGGRAITVNTGAGTSYVNADGTTAAATDVKQGTLIAAQGSLSQDGATLTAERIVIAPKVRFGLGRGNGTPAGTATGGQSI